MTISNPTAPAQVHTNGTNGAAPANIGSIRSTDIVGEMQVAYLDYAMSVIVARALPDVRDGLKPVHRRILYAMYADLGLFYDKPHKKSARIVGEVLGKYHPHGDVAVYDAMARMAQDFSLRYPLVDGQGNFGSIDGDSPAAMRYTEARLAEVSHLIIEDLDKDTVSWNANFDNTLEEPAVLPAALPNLLINGANGIAVGMATNIPPHNLGEVVDALAYMIDHFDQADEIAAEELLRFVKGPDFPTGGIVYRYRVDNKSDEETDAIAQGYSVGKSKLIMQAKAHFEEMSRGRSRIIITQLPYQTNKSTLLERIADLVRDEKLVGISDLRDESDRTGMRVVIELSRNIEPKDVLADLFKYTPLQQTFGMQMLALVDGQPRLLSLKRMLQLFIQHRQEIVRRRSEYDLTRARERAHIVEGLLKALDILDEVISTIRNSQRVETARANLVKNFGFSEVQAQAILDMQLRRLAAMERTKLKDEYKELKERIAELEDLLAHPEKILALIKSELLAIKEKHGDARRTQIVDRTKGTLTTTDLLPDETVWVSVSNKGEVRRQLAGKMNNTLLRQVGRNSDVAVVTANTRDPLYLFTADGRSVRMPVHEIPADGVAKKVAELGGGRGDALVAALTLPSWASSGGGNGYLCLVTEQGMVKRISLADLLAVGPGVPTVMGVNDKDRLGWVFPTRGNGEVLLVAASGQAIRFSEEDVRSMGLPAGGVGGVKLKKGDKVVYAAAVDPSGELITVTVHGFAKRSALPDYPVQGRNGGGIVTHKLSDRTGQISAALLTPTGVGDETLLGVTRKGVPKLVAYTDIPAMGRGVLGKPVVETSPGDTLVLLQRVADPSQLNPPEPAGEDQPSTPSAEPVEPAAPKRNISPAKPAATRKADVGQVPLKLPTNPPKATDGKPSRATDGAQPKRITQSAAKGKAETPARKPISAPVPLQKAAVTPSTAEKATPSARGGVKPAPAPPTGKSTATARDSVKQAFAPSPGKSASAARSGAKPATTGATTRTAKVEPASPRPASSQRGSEKTVAPAPMRLTPKTQAGGHAPPTPSPTRSSTKTGAKAQPPPEPEPATQAPLFAVESTTPSPAQNGKSKKVQTVVSVPAGQVRKKK